MLTLKEIKDKIESNTLGNSLLIIESPDNYFTADQYISRIAINKHLEIVYTDVFPHTSNNACLYVYTTDLLDDTTILSLENCIIRCKKYVGTVYSDFVITIPKLENWQIKDYAFNKLSGLDKTDIELLCQVCKYDIYTLQFEIDKLSLVSADQQKQLFQQGKSAGLYATDISIFDFTNAILQNNKDKALMLYHKLDKTNISGYQVLNSLIKSFKYIIRIQLGLNVTAAELGLTDKQYYAIRKNNLGYYTQDKLIAIYKLLTDIDYLVKSSFIQAEQINKYLLINIFGG